MDLSQIKIYIGYSFKNDKLLEQALTHRSYAGPNNERLEFLGDSLLNFLIAEELYKKFPNASEGVLTRLRASMVKGETLAEIAKELKVGDFLRLGRGEMNSGGNWRTSVLADAFEAIIAAIYFDAGIETCRDKILGWYQTRLENLSPKVTKDAKSQLQELMQAKRLPLPSYSLISATEDSTNPEFTVSCRVNLIDEEFIGKSSSIRKAEQKAARKVLERLEK